MRGAKVENGVIVAIWEVPSLTAFKDIALIEPPATVGVGWLYADGVFTTPEPLPPTTDEIKRTGILILGVMCSATKDDQNGLTAIAMGVTLARAASTAFPDTVFQFSNGTTLTITDSNFNAIYAAWVPFRQGFFKPSMAQ